MAGVSSDLSSTSARPARAGIGRRLESIFAEFAFVASVAVIAFLLGFYFTEKHWAPYRTLHNAVKTTTSLYTQLFPPFGPEQFIGFDQRAPADAARNRIIVRQPLTGAPADEHFLMTGGLNEYLDYCPRFGCVAVEFTRSGKVVHAWQYRPDLLATKETVSRPYEEMLFRFTTNRYPVGLIKLPDGDLVVTFQQWNTFPFAGGIARIHPDGTPVWFRHDYSHHWPRLLSANEIAVPAMRIGPSKISFPLAESTKVEFACDGKIEKDIVRILDTGGRVKQEISVFDAVAHSPWRGMLVEAPNPCVPLHLNYVTSVTPAMVHLFHDVAADDLLVSLRDLNALAIIGRRDHRLKHMFTGTFLRQHSAQPLGQSATTLIFDDHGADWSGGPSRLLAFDLATHDEKTLFPNANARGATMFSDTAGNISISPDATRAIVASSWDGKAYEVRISDGAVLTVFNNIHDISKVSEAGSSRMQHAGRFVLGGIYYVQ
jgi:hypothetical protein